MPETISRLFCIHIDWRCIVCYYMKGNCTNKKNCTKNKVLKLCTCKPKICICHHNKPEIDMKLLHGSKLSNWFWQGGSHMVKLTVYPASIDSLRLSQKPMFAWTRHYWCRRRPARCHQDSRESTATIDEINNELNRWSSQNNRSAMCTPWRLHVNFALPAYTSTFLENTLNERKV